MCLIDETIDSAFKSFLKKIKSRVTFGLFYKEKSYISLKQKKKRTFNNYMVF